MERIDALGRRRQPSQNRGLRPLHPLLPPGIVSRSIRVAMTAEAWERLEQAVETSEAPTSPRAVGDLIEAALDATSRAPVADWLQWQIHKEKALLGRDDAIAS